MNIYKQLKSFGNIKTANEVYTSIIYNSLMQLFEYKGLDNVTSMTYDNFEALLLTNGKATMIPYNDTFVPCSLYGMGEKNPLGNYENYTGYYINHHTAFENRPDKDIAVCRNTSDGLPALNVMRFADMLSEVDLSMVFNVQRSRLAPIAIAEDDTQRKQIQNCMNATAKGNYEVIAASILNSGQPNSGKVNILNLNDVTAIQYIQYLSEFHDALTRRIYTMYGFAVQETSKHAQVNTDESNARDGVSWLIPDNMLKCRKQFCDEFNKLNGTNLSVDYSPLAKCEREIMENRRETNDTVSDTNTNDSNNNDSAAKSE